MSWLLFLLMATVQDDGSVRVDRQYLSEFKDYETCTQMATKIQGEMELAYPGDTSFKLVCKRGAEI